MKIKILNPGDENLLLEFLQNLPSETLNQWSHYGKIFDLNKVKQILSNSEVKIVGLEVNGKIVVLGHLYDQFIFTNPLRSQKNIRLGIVCSVSRKGYGMQMMNYLIDYCRSQGISSIYLSVFQDNIPAINLYKKCGFKIVQEFTDRPRYAYEMELILNNAI